MKKQVTVNVLNKRSSPRIKFKKLEDDIDRKAGGKVPDTLGVPLRPAPECVDREAGEKQEQPCPDGCADTFDRTVNGGGGTSEIGGVTWSNHALYSVDDKKLRIDLSAPSAQGSINADFGMTFPIEFTWDQAWQGPAPSASQSHTVLGGFGVNNTGLSSTGPLLTFSIGVDGSISGRLRNADGLQTSFNTTITSGVTTGWIHCRFRVEVNHVYAKAWTGTEEPVDWDLDFSSVGSIGTDFLLVFGHNSHNSENGMEVYITNLRFVVGIDCDDGTDCIDIEDEYGAVYASGVSRGGPSSGVVLDGIPINSRATRISSTEYQVGLPAKSISSVTVDGLLMPSATWIFMEPSSVIFDDPVDVGATVWIRYLA